MKLDKYQCELLDVVLDAFGNGDSLSRESLLDLFGQDEPMAAAMVGVLAADRLVEVVGATEEHDLPAFINRENLALLFLKNGGYSRQYEEAAAKQNASKELEALQKTNLQLQNEALTYQESLREKEEQIRALDVRIKRLELLKYIWWLAGLLMSVLGWWAVEMLKQH